MINKKGYGRYRARYYLFISGRTGVRHRTLCDARTFEEAAGGTVWGGGTAMSEGGTVEGVGVGDLEVDNRCSNMKLIEPAHQRYCLPNPMHVFIWQ